MTKTIEILLVGGDAACLEVPDRIVHITSVATTQMAARRLRNTEPDLAVVAIESANEVRAKWVERLRAAKPFLSVVIVFDERQLAPTLEVRLRSAGVTAIVCLRDGEWREWIEQWLAARGVRLALSSKGPVRQNGRRAPLRQGRRVKEG